MDAIQLEKEIKRINSYGNMISKSLIREGLALRNDIILFQGGDVLESNRKPINTDARKIFIKILVDAGFSKKSVGRFLGKDHATIINQFQKAEDLIDSDKSFRNVYRELEQEYFSNDGALSDNVKDYYTRQAIKSLEDTNNKLSSHINELEERLSKLEQITGVIQPISIEG